MTPPSVVGESFGSSRFPVATRKLAPYTAPPLQLRPIALGSELIFYSDDSVEDRDGFFLSSFFAQFSQRFIKKKDRPEGRLIGAGVHQDWRSL